MSVPTLYQPRPVLSSQRYSPSSEYVDTRRSSIASASRLPLRESNGNAQAYGLNGLAACYQSPVSLSPTSMHQPSLQAPIVPSQSFDALYRLQTPRQQQQQNSYQRRHRRMNPLYLWPAFRQYRHRQAHKDTQKDKGGVWRRPELEDAFVDAVLLMPHMGRRKFSMGGKLHGRNMLISEYIFVICVALLGSKEIFRIDNSNDSIEQMGRKQVSSHMQVVKKFFEDLRCFHFLFPSEEKKEPGSTNSDDYYEDEEQESFKSNPVLTALAENRVPDVKPNYEYFSTLLDLQSSICVRPKTCEIFVSSSSITMRDDTAYDINEQALDQSSFPHLHKYKNADDGPNVLGKDVLLHEYTRTLDRSTSACVKSVTRRWQKDAPAMYETLDLPSSDEDCLLIEMCSTVELHEHTKFPSGSELTGFVQVAITPSTLQGHRWKCVTRLTRPEELHSDDAQSSVYSNESGIHHRGCNDSRPDCDCHLRPRSDIHVPFPAVEWASILSMAVEYPDVEHQRKKDRRHGNAKDGSKRPELERSSSKRKRSEDEGDATSWSRREPTGSDLICKVAMYQELWSCAPDSGRWVRQAIIFWRFQTTNQWYKYNPVFKPAGTSWRWLTINDPMSRYHQQKALVYPSQQQQGGMGVSRDALMSPTPTLQQQRVGTRSENFSNAWEPQHQQVSIPHLTNIPASNSMGMFDSFANGLATPPPSASLHGSYPGSFDAGSMASSNGMPFLPSNANGGGDSQANGLAGSHHQPYFEGQATAFTDVKPVGAAPQSMNAYMPVTTTSLDHLSTHLVYDGGADTTHQHQQHQPQQHPNGMQSWDMSTLDPWTAAAAATNSATTGDGTEWGGPPAPPSSAGAKLDGGDASALWQGPGQWSMAGATTTGTTTPQGSREMDGSSPRDMKRRRTEGMVEPPPSASGW